MTTPYTLFTSLYAGPFNQWQQACQTWQAQCAQALQQSTQNWQTLWQGSAAYWQTVACIMNMRAQCGQYLLANQQACLQQLLQCGPNDYPKALGIVSQAYAQTISQLTLLNTTTHQQRMLLWQQLQMLATRCAPQGSWQAWPQQATEKTPTPQTPTAPMAATSSAPVVQQPYTQLKGWFVAGPVKAKAFAAPVAAVTPAQPVVQAVKTEPQFESAKQPEQPLATADSIPQTSLLFPIVSRTGDSAVVRSGNGAVATAAAAVRRSVVARRAQRKGRLARAR